MRPRGISAASAIGSRIFRAYAPVKSGTPPAPARTRELRRSRQTRSPSLHTGKSPVVRPPAVLPSATNQPAHRRRPHTNAHRLRNESENAHRRRPLATNPRARSRIRSRNEESESVDHLLYRAEHPVATRTRAEVERHQAAERLGRATLEQPHAAVDAPREEEPRQRHQPHLPLGRQAAAGRAGPQQHDQRVARQHEKGRDDVRVAHLDEEVVEVRLVGMERRLSAQHAHAHDAHRVEHGNRKHGQRESHDREAAGVEQLSDLRRLHGPHDEHRHHHAHDERAAVADIHFRPEAEDVVHEEGDERADRGERQHAERQAAAAAQEHGAEYEAGHDAEARREAVHTVDQVQGIDDAHACEDRERHRDRAGQAPHAPQTVEVVQTVVAREDQQAHGEDLRHETRGGTQVQNVVHRTRIEHDHHGGNHHEERRAVAHHIENGRAEDNAEEDQHTAQNRHGLLLELAGIGLVHDLLELGDPHDVRMHEPHRDERDHEGRQDEQCLVHGKKINGGGDFQPPG